MMESQLDIEDLIREDEAREPSSDKLDRLRVMAKQVIKAKERVGQAEEDLQKAKDAFKKLTTKDMPDLFAAAGVDSIGLDGNYNMDVVCENFYHANIGAEWAPERKDAAFAWMEANGHGDLIKIVVSISFGRSELKKALGLVEQLREDGFTPTIQKTIPWNTLTAWLKEQVEKYSRVPPLELLGATVGKIAKLKERK